MVNKLHVGKFKMAPLKNMCLSMGGKEEERQRLKVHIVCQFPPTLY